jgi:hypothetical protein
MADPVDDPLTLARRAVRKRAKVLRQRLHAHAANGEHQLGHGGQPRAQHALLAAAEAVARLARRHLEQRRRAAQ